MSATRVAGIKAGSKDQVALRAAGHAASESAGRIACPPEPVIHEVSRANAHTNRAGGLSYFPQTVRASA